jgi:hypothetical protein
MPFPRRQSDDEFHRPPGAILSHVTPAAQPGRGTRSHVPPLTQMEISIAAETCQVSEYRQTAGSASLET